MADLPKGAFPEYRGTLPLTEAEFPRVMGDDGRESNILTEYATIGDAESPKYVLYPTFRKGMPLDWKAAQEDAVQGGQHFCIYDNLRQMQVADSLIHDHFNKMIETERKHTPQVEDTIMKIMQDVDSLRMK